MRIRGASILGAGLAVLLLTGAAGAGILRSDLKAMADYRGYRTYNATDKWGNPLYALYCDVDFAVYYPGSFAAAFGEGSDPSVGKEYVYAYQIFNNLALPPGINPPTRYKVSQFSVGLLITADADNVGFLADANRDPSTSTFTTTAAKWTYSNPGLAVGAYGDILIFTSPYAPSWGAVGGLVGGMSQSLAMPSPGGTRYDPPAKAPAPGTPEPATMSLLLLGSAALLRRKT